MPVLLINQVRTSSTTPHKHYCYNLYMCPCCKKTVPHNPRFKNYLCGACSRLITDNRGRAVGFFNESLSGGLIGYFLDEYRTPTDKVYENKFCFLDGRKYQAVEGHMGGIYYISVENQEEDRANQTRI